MIFEYLKVLLAVIGFLITLIGIVIVWMYIIGFIKIERRR